MKYLTRVVCLSAMLALALSQGACNKDKGEAGKGITGTAISEGADPAFLGLIPADTPYVVASFQPVPADVMDGFFKKFGPVYDQSIAALQAQLQAELTQGAGTPAATANTPPADPAATPPAATPPAADPAAKPADPAAKPADPTAVAAPVAAPSPETAKKAAVALLEELKGNFSPEGMAKLGLSTQPMFAFYGIGLLPAARLELKDVAAFWAMVDRVQAKSGLVLNKLKLGEQEYRTFAAEGVTVAMATVGTELVATIGPDAAMAEVLPLLFGQKKPEKSLRDAGTLRKVMSDYSFKPYAVGYLDAKVIAATLMGDATGTNAAVLTAMQLPLPAVTPVCKTEINGMVNNAPRIVFGYDELTAQVVTMRGIVELEATLAKALSGLRAPVAGLSEQIAGSPLMALGLGLDVAKTIEFAKAKAAAIQTAPYQCELLAEMNSSAGQLTAALSQQLPPFVTSLKGINILVQEADMQGGAPSNIKAVAVLASENPMMLVGMLQGMVPELAAMKIDPEGKPSPVPPMASLPMLKDAQVAVKGSTLAISLGPEMAAELPKLIDAKPADDAPMMVVAYDMGRLMQKITSFTSAMAGALSPESKAEMDRSMAVNTAMSGMMGLTTYSMQINDKGIVFKQKAMFK